MSCSAWLSANKPAIVSLKLLVADRRFDAKHVIRIALVGDQMARLDRVELADGKAEELGDLPKELLLLPMDFPVGFCDVEETVKHILKQLAVALEYGDELFSTGLEIGCVPLGRIEDGRGLLHLRAETL